MFKQYKHINYSIENFVQIEAPFVRNKHYMTANINRGDRVYKILASPIEEGYNIDLPKNIQLELARLSYTKRLLNQRNNNTSIAGIETHDLENYLKFLPEKFSKEQIYIDVDKILNQ